MQAELAWRDEADQLIALHGPGAIGRLVSRISDAVRLCDDRTVAELDRVLQLVEARLEDPWRRRSMRLADPQRVTRQSQTPIIGAPLTDIVAAGSSASSVEPCANASSSLSSTMLPFDVT